jgi:hypothetical protein
MPGRPQEPNSLIGAHLRPKGVDAPAASPAGCRPVREPMPACTRAPGDLRPTRGLAIVPLGAVPRAHDAPVAQLDRALPSEGKGREFESRRVRHFPLPLSP